MSEQLPAADVPVLDGSETAASMSGEGSTDARSVVPVRRRFACFEGLRALAALMVVVHHASSFAGEARSPAPFFRTAALFDSGVIVFFVISGFLIYRPFVLAHLEGRPAMRTRAFWWRRLLRLVPAYWVALTVLWAIGAADLRLGAWRYYLFVQVYGRGSATRGMVQAWSLCVEAVFYLLVPAWVVLVRRSTRSSDPAQVARRHLVGCGLLYGIGFLSRGLISIVNPSWRGISFEWPPTNVDFFALGMGLAVLSAWAGTDPALRARLDRWARHGELWWAAAIGLFAWYVVTVGPVSLARFADPNGPWRGWPWQQRQLVLGLAAAMLLVPAVFGPEDRGLVRRTLRLRPVAWVGLVSYGLYLWHYGFITKAVGRLDPTTLASIERGWLGTPPFDSNLLAVGAVGLGLGLVAAAISWYAVERPLERLKTLVR